MCKTIKILIIIILTLSILYICFKNDNKEGFKSNETYSSKSNSYDVSQGSSMRYGWGYPDDNPQPPPPKKHHDKKCPPPHPPKPTPYCPPPPPQPPLPEPTKCEPDYNGKCSPSQCKECDITLNKDIDKYVLKSSIPPYPNMSDYVKKSMLPPQINMDEYIHKSKIPSCNCPPRPDLSKYVLKADVPGCPRCPQIPKCPLCPLPKPISEYNISSHPDFKNYKHKDDCKKEVQKLRKDLENQINDLKNKEKQIQQKIQNAKSKIINNNFDKINDRKHQIYNFRQNCENQTPPIPKKQCY